MNEDRFWEIIDIVNWESDCDYKRIRTWFLRNLSMEESNSFRSILVNKVNALNKMIGNRNPANSSDDGYNDLLNHVVGLGKKQYEAHLADYSLLETRGEVHSEDYHSPNGYVESFSYCIPYEDDYEKLETNNVVYTNWAKRIIVEYQSLLDLDTKGVLDDDIVSDLKYVINTVKLLENNDINGFMANREETEIRLEKLGDYFTKNYMELPRKFTEPDRRLTKWAVKNLYHDLIYAIEVNA